MSNFNTRGNLRNALRNYRGNQMLVDIEVWTEKRGCQRGGYIVWKQTGQRYVFKDVKILDYAFVKQEDETAVSIYCKDVKNSKRKAAVFRINEELKDTLHHSHSDNYIDSWRCMLNEDKMCYLRITKKRHWNVGQQLREYYPEYKKTFETISKAYMPMEYLAEDFERMHINYAMLKLIMKGFEAWAQEIEKNVDRERAD